MFHQIWAAGNRKMRCHLLGCIPFQGIYNVEEKKIFHSVLQRVCLTFHAVLCTERPATLRKGLLATGSSIRISLSTCFQLLPWALTLSGVSGVLRLLH